MTTVSTEVETTFTIMRTLFALLATVTLLHAEEPRVSAVPEEVRREFALAPFYEKYVSVGGVPIVSSAKVNDAALLEARHLIEKMIGHRPDVLAAIAKNKVRVAIMAPTEFTTDIPEHSDLRPREHWDKRARGLGATPVRPAVSCGEENLLCFTGDPYAAENILIHEFGHVIHERGLSAVDKTFDARLMATFNAAMAKGLWKDKYAAVNRMEYWAEGTQSWFDTNRENDHDHNWVNTRAELKEYDPDLAKLLAEVYGDGEWRYSRPAARTPASPHMAGYDAAKAPHFSWKTLYERQAAGAEKKDEPIPLAQHPADEREDWRSPKGGEKVKLYFSNQRKEHIEVVWMDFEGRPQPSLKMRPGELKEQQTFAGHIFRVLAEDGKVLGCFIARERDGSVVVK